MNVPCSVDGNRRERLPPEPLTDELAARLGAETEAAGRLRSSRAAAGVER